MRLNEDSYRKKVRAGWLGKCIGGNLGAIPECLKKRSYFLKPEDFMPEKMLANDDLDLQLVWLQVLLDKGLSFTSDDLMEEFIKNGIPNLFECDLDTQTAIIDLFVDKIIVKEDGLQVIWNQ